MENQVDTRHVEITSAAPSGMSVAIMDAEGDYGAVVVSNANNLIAPQQLDQGSLWQDTGMLLLQNEVPEAINLVAAKRAKITVRWSA